MISNICVIILVLPAILCYCSLEKYIQLVGPSDIYLFIQHPELSSNRVIHSLILDELRMKAFDVEINVDGNTTNSRMMWIDIWMLETTPITASQYVHVKIMSNSSIVFGPDCRESFVLFV